jgi:hypothetical protein
MLLQSGWREARTVVGVQVPQETSAEWSVVAARARIGRLDGNVSDRPCRHRRTRQAFVGVDRRTVRQLPVRSRDEERLGLITNRLGNTVAE